MIYQYPGYWKDFDACRPPVVDVGAAGVGVAFHARHGSPSWMGMGTPDSPPPKKKMFPQGLLNLIPRFFIFFCVAWPFFLGFYESQVPGRWKEKPPCCRWSLWSRCARWEVFKGRKTSWSSSGILDLSCRILDQEFINADLFIVIKWYQVLFFQYTSCWFKNFPAWQIKLFIYFFFACFVVQVRRNSGQLLVTWTTGRIRHFSMELWPTITIPQVANLPRWRWTWPFPSVPTSAASAFAATEQDSWFHWSHALENSVLSLEFLFGSQGAKAGKILGHDPSGSPAV